MLHWAEGQRTKGTVQTGSTRKFHRVDYESFIPPGEGNFTDMRHGSHFPFKTVGSQQHKAALVLYARCADSRIPTHGNSLGSNENLFLSNSRIINKSKT